MRAGTGLFSRPPRTSQIGLRSLGFAIADPAELNLDFVVVDAVHDAAAWRRDRGYVERLGVYQAQTQLTNGTIVLRHSWRQRGPHCHQDLDVQTTT